MPDIEDAVAAIGNNLESLNESDSNGEAANVVDGLFAIARAIQNLADAVDDAADKRDFPGKP
jgi:hypothetical protein